MKLLYSTILLLSTLNEVSLRFLPHHKEILVKKRTMHEIHDLIEQLFHPINVSDGREGRYCQCPFNSSYYVSPFDVTPIWIVKLSYQDSSGVLRKVIAPALILNEYYILMKKGYFQYLLGEKLYGIFASNFFLFDVDREFSPGQEAFHIKKYAEYPDNRIADVNLSFLSNDLILLQLDRPIIFTRFQHKSYGLGPVCFRTKRTAQFQQHNKIKTDMNLKSFLGEVIRIYEKRCLMPKTIKAILEYLKTTIPKLVCRNKNDAAVKKIIEAPNKNPADDFIKKIKIENVISLKENGYMRHIGFCPSLHNTYQEIIELTEPSVVIYHFLPPRLFCLSLSAYEKWLISNMPEVQCQLYSTVT